MLICMPFIVIPILINEKWGQFSFFFVKMWALLSGTPCFIFFKSHGKVNVDKKKSYIFEINHTSFLDAPAIAASTPIQLRALGKKELSQVPIFGFITSRLAVWVDRSSPESRSRSIGRLLKMLDKGISILVAPEGTRNASDKPLLPFYNGPFRLAIETGIPIVPFIIHDAKKLMPKGQLGVTPGTIHSYFLPEIPTAGLIEDDLPALKEKVYKIMKDKVLALDQEAGN